MHPPHSPHTHLTPVPKNPTTKHLPNLPPPWLWQRYGNLQTFPRPTQKPTHVSRYWALLSHLGLSSASSTSIFSSCSWEGIRSASPGFGNFNFNFILQFPVSSVECRNERNSRRVWPSGEEAAVCFCFCKCVWGDGYLSVSFCGLSPTRSWSPSARPWKRDSVIYCDLWHFNRSYQWLMTVLFELCNVSYFKKGSPAF